MERIESIENSESIVLMDHYHRYQWASSCVYGTVLDVACGIGYGSRFIINNSRVTKYIGVDIAPKAINKAKTDYSSDICSFHLGNVYDLSFLQDESIDVIVSMETIEHLDQPDVALKEFRRILKRDGILIGSVPTKSLDEHHDQYDGGNQYHLTRFDLDVIRALLSKYFNLYNIYLSRIQLCIETQPLIKSFDCNCSVQVNSISTCKDEKDLGIFMFVASSRNLDELELGPILSSTSSVFLGPLYFDNHAKYINLYDKYLDSYDKYTITTNLYHDLEKLYHDMEEKYIQLYSDHQKLISNGKG